jgi:hypothetical protein
MRAKNFWITIVFIVLCACSSKNENENVISFSSLLKEMTNNKLLTQFPSPAYRLMQASSWDRSQTDPKDTITWFANKDYNQWIREEKVGDRTEYVLMDSRGPGVISRWWMPLAEELKNRTVRIYLDDNPAPVIEENYHNFVSGNSYVPWPFAFVSSDEKDAIHQYSLPLGMRQFGADLYLPIPYAKSCKVTLDIIPFYFVINYREYDKDTKVESFTREDFEKNKALLTSIGEELLADINVTNNTHRQAAKLAQGEFLEINLPQGENAISAIRLNINSKEDKQKNRSTVLQIKFDGIETVWSPVSEFFGGGVYARPVKNNKIEVSESGFMSTRWIMPYKKNATVTLKNFGKEGVDAELVVEIEKYEWNETSMYFHSKWHEEAPLKRPPFNKDWNYIEVEGKGVYVGDVLTIHAEHPGWWGEGDERVYIDGKKFPSHLGTGLEDYYGYAWGMANFFSSPFISMPERDARGKGDWTGYTTVARLRQLDAIPFQSSLKVDIEANTHAGTSFSVTSFWYAMAGSSDNVNPDERTILRKLPDFQRSKLTRLPGEKFPDPAMEGLVKPLGNGSIKQVGNHLDLLKWKDKQEHKSLDIDLDNEYGTAGYYLFGVFRYDVINQAILTDSTQTLPDFVKLINYQTAKKGNGAVLPMPQEYIFHRSGTIEEVGDRAQKGVLSFTLNKDAPLNFRLGIMIDNAEDFDKVGEFLKVTSSNGGDSGFIPLAQSNRLPEWYFFDLSGMKSGEVITIKGKTKNPNDIFSLGAITFDVKN